MQDLLILEDVIPSLPLTVECIGSYLIKNKNYKIFVSTKENHLLIYKLDRLKIDLHIKLERTIKLKYKIEQIECYQDAGILLTIQDSKFIVRDLFSPDVELPDIIGMCPILNSSVIA